MSLSACVKCWDHFCTCGWDYRQLPLPHRLAIAAAALGIPATALDSLVVPRVHPLAVDAPP